jgi:hypothetical protein
MQQLGTNLPITPVSYMSGGEQFQVGQMRKTGIGGLTWNMLFLRRVLVIDTQRKLFGLASSLAIYL